MQRIRKAQKHIIKEERSRRAGKRREAEKQASREKQRSKEEGKSRRVEKLGIRNQTKTENTYINSPPIVHMLTINGL